MRWTFVTLSAAALCFCFAALGAPADWNADGWFVARSPHFESYSQSGPERARWTLERFEELRAFFNQNRSMGLAREPHEMPPVRIVEFRTAKEYEAVKIDDKADAYYSAGADLEYIVMPIFAGNSLGIAAHEYTHFALHAGGLKLPPWLNEGLAELLSTITIKDRRCELGGPLPIHVDALHRNSWFPAEELFSLKPAEFQTRARAGIFYAESWALTDMLTAAPEYAPRFAELVETLNSGTASSVALFNIYGKSPQLILTEARTWIHHGGSPRRQSPLSRAATAVDARPVPQQQALALIAGLFLTNGNWGRAEAIYGELLRRSPNDPELLASLGTTAVRKGDDHGAAEYWRKALNAGLKNPSLCYRYALLADRMNLPSTQIEQALERAIALQPNFDDARFRLALLKNNRSDYAAAIDQLQAMSAAPPTRAYGYWTALSYALAETGKRNEAEAAALQAKRFAANSEERDHAGKLAYMAQTEMSVQFRRDTEGRLQLVTTRVPHGETGRNPFVEADDHMETASGRLQEVQCTDGKLTGFLIESFNSTLTLSVPDPARVLIRRGPSEFTCGPQPDVSVHVEYATTARPGGGLLRGIEF